MSEQTTPRKRRQSASDVKNLKDHKLCTTLIINYMKSFGSQQSGRPEPATVPAQTHLPKDMDAKYPVIIIINKVPENILASFFVPSFQSHVKDAGGKNRCSIVS